ncbi:hypothetical protein ACFODZ_10110 [Marinicella sediminis]|uniref:Uncharacterized protein n=1 Tax=Marinicella sediminis TaxID=1792834 RepID=A0ABV7J9G9_9GAMM|nr:hypothetical protein [Marinicella sediminis]
MLRKSLVIIILLAGLALLLFWLAIHNKQEHSNLKANNPQKTDPQATIERPDNRQPKDPTIHQNEPDKTHSYSALKQKLLAEMTSRTYSDDPYLEVKSLAWELGYCAQQAELGTLFGEQPSTEQVALLELVAENCELKAQAYPTLLELYNDNNWQDLFQPQSHLAQVFELRKTARNKDEIRELTQSIITAALQSENGALLMGETLLGYLDQGSLLFAADQLLGTKDQDYANNINTAALTLLACGFNEGIHCQSDGMYMLFNCAYQHSACGLDYTTWFQQNTLPGMQQDVQILVHFYQQISSPSR